MDPTRAILPLILLVLVGCDAGRPPPAAANAPPPTGSNQAMTSGMEFSGERDCVDCDGIESWLRLEQAGKMRRYRMVEVYYGPDHDRRFEDAGEWSTDGELLRLRSGDGNERVYARSADGYLEARGAHGQRIPAAEGDVLEPARFDRTR